MDHPPLTPNISTRPAFFILQVIQFCSQMAAYIFPHHIHLPKKVLSISVSFLYLLSKLLQDSVPSFIYIIRPAFPGNNMNIYHLHPGWLSGILSVYRSTENPKLYSYWHLKYAIKPSYRLSARSSGL